VAHHPERDVHDGQENLNIVVAAAYNITIYCVYVYTILRRHLTKVKTCFQERKDIRTDNRKRRPVVVKQPRVLSKIRKKMHIHAKGRVYYIIRYFMCLLPIGIWYYYYYLEYTSRIPNARGVVYFWIVYRYLRQYHIILFSLTKAPREFLYTHSLL